MRTSPGTRGTKGSFSRESVLKSWISDMRGELCTRTAFAARFGTPAHFGMVHLRPLPGAPLFAGSMDAAIEAALADVRALAEGGADGYVVENFGDRPFFKERVPPETIAAMTRVITVLARAVPLPFGVNVL